MVIIVFLGYCFLEVYALFRLGEELGAWNLLGFLVLSFAAGLLVLFQLRRRLGKLAKNGLQAALGASPSGMPAGGGIKIFASIFFQGLAGVLLLLPGIISTALGLSLLLEPVQALIRGRAIRHLAQKNGFARVIRWISSSHRYTESDGLDAGQEAGRQTRRDFSVIDVDSAKK